MPEGARESEELDCRGLKVSIRPENLRGWGNQEIKEKLKGEGVPPPAVCLATGRI